MRFNSFLLENPIINDVSIQRTIDTINNDINTTIKKLKESDPEFDPKWEGITATREDDNEISIRVHVRKFDFDKKFIVTDLKKIIKKNLGKTTIKNTISNGRGGNLEGGMTILFGEVSNFDIKNNLIINKIINSKIEVAKGKWKETRGFNRNKRFTAFVDGKPYWLNIIDESHRKTVGGFNDSSKREVIIGLFINDKDGVDNGIKLKLTKMVGFNISNKRAENAWKVIDKILGKVFGIKSVHI